MAAALRSQGRNVAKQVGVAGARISDASRGQGEVMQSLRCGAGGRGEGQDAQGPVFLGYPKRQGAVSHSASSQGCKLAK